MDPSKIFCHNPDFPARGKVGCGNIGIHSRKQRRYICHECGKTFTESRGAVFYPRVRGDHQKLLHAPDNQRFPKIIQP